MPPKTVGKPWNRFCSATDPARVSRKLRHVFRGRPPVRSSGSRGSFARPVRLLRNRPAGAARGPSQAKSCHLRLEMSKELDQAAFPARPGTGQIRTGGGGSHRGFPQWGHCFLPAFDFCTSSTKPAPTMPVGRANIPIPKTALTAAKNFPQKVTGYTSP